MTLSSSGTIYVLSENRATSGYTIAANKIGFVILPGFALTSNLNTTLSLSSGTKFNWVEGSFGESSATSIVSFQSSYSEIRNVSIEDQNATTGLLVSSNYNVLKKIRVSGTMGTCISLVLSQFSLLSDSSTSSCDIGLEVVAGTKNKLMRLQHLYHTSIGIYLSGAGDNLFANIRIAFANSGISSSTSGMASFYDVSISDSSYCTYMSGDSYIFVNSRFINCSQTRFTLYTLNGTFLSTLIANMGSDLYLYRVHDSIFHNLLIVNSGSWKIFHNTSTNLIFSNVAVNTAIDLYDGDNWKFTNALLLVQIPPATIRVQELTTDCKVEPVSIRALAMPLTMRDSILTAPFMVKSVQIP